MNQDQKFQQIWEFRRREDDLDSSSNDSKSSSIDEPVLKKHKMDSNLILPENDETSNSPRSQHKEGDFVPYEERPFEFEKANKKLIIGSSKKNNELKKKKKGSLTDGKMKKKKKGSLTDGKMKKKKKGSLTDGKRKKKNECVTYKPISLEDFKMFMESILEELKVARENMFASMREDTNRLVGIGIAPTNARKKTSRVRKIVQSQSRNTIEIGTKVRNCGKRTDDSSNHHQVLEEQINHDQAIGTIASNEKEKREEWSRLSVKKPKISSDTPHQVVSSSYLTLPTVLSKPTIENHRLDSFTCNYIQPGETGNNTRVNVERENSTINPSSHRGYFSRIQQEDDFGSFAQTASKNMASLDQKSTQASSLETGFAQKGSKITNSFDQQSIQTSSLGTGFPIPLHRGLDSSSNVGSQVNMENSPQKNSTSGLRMNGGAIRFSGGGYGLTQNFSANNYRSHVNYKSDVGLMAFGAQEVKEGRLYPN